MDPETRRTIFKRKPLLDCTNTSPPSALRPKLKPRDSNLSKNDTSTRSNYAENSDNQTPVEKTPTISDAVKNNNSQVGTVYSRRKLGKKKKATVNLGQKKRAAIKSSSCPPVGRTGHLWGKLEKKCGDVGPSRMFSVSCLQNCGALSIRGKLEKDSGNVGPSSICSASYFQNRKKPRSSMPGPANNPGLPQDFIDQQRAYFADIDAFELQEEVVSDKDESG